MRLHWLLGTAILVVAGCTPPPPPPSGQVTAIRAPAPGGGPPQPLNYAAGTPLNTTNAFDGTYNGVFGQREGGSTATAPVLGPTCRNYTINDLPPVVIANGLAQFQANDITFQGYVTPQGELSMASGGVQGSFNGQITQNTIFGHLVGQQCQYTLKWQKSS